MLSFKALSEKKTNVKINPNINDLKEMETNHGEDCDCMKCEKKRRKGDKEPEVATESAVPGKPAEKVGALTNIDIPQDERDAAKARLLAKAKAKREAMKKEEYEIEEGMSLKDFKANRKKNERRAASADAEKRGHVGKEWHNTGRKYSADDAKSNRAKLSDDDRAARHRAAVDPDDDRDENTYSADKTKNPKKLRKQKAMGEIKNEETAYDSQEEVSKESNQRIGQEETSMLTFAQYNEGIKHGIIKGVKGAVKGAATGAAIGGAIAATGGAAAVPAAAAGLGAGAVKGAAVHGTIGTVRSDKQQDKEANAVKKARKEEYEYVDEGVKGAIKGAAKGIAKGAALGALGAGAVAAAGLTGGASIPVAAASGAAMHGAYNAVKGASRNDKLHKLRQADQKKRDAKLLASASKTKKESANLLSFGNFTELNEGRAEDAQKSLAAVKKRQSVLDAHEKKTGKKLDISKTPEHKAHKQNFPGSRQEKKVRGAKETPLETQNRRANRFNKRVIEKGYTSKEKKDNAAMAKHTSRYD